MKIYKIDLKDTLQDTQGIIYAAERSALGNIRQFSASMRVCADGKDCKSFARLILHDKDCEIRFEWAMKRILRDNIETARGGLHDQRRLAK